MKRGPKNKPRAVKKARGTLQPCRDDKKLKVVDFPAVDVLPKCPVWVKDKFGKETFKKTAAILIKQRILTEADIDFLGMYCNVFNYIIKRQKQHHPVLATDWTTYRLFAAELGLTPAARAKVPAAPERAKGSKFERLAKRKDELSNQV